MNINTILKKTFATVASTALYCFAATAQGKSEATIELSYLKKADMSKSVSAVVKAKNKEEKFVSAKNARVDFYVLDKNELQLIKSTNTNEKGLAVVSLQNDLPLDDSLYFTIVAKIQNHSLYEDVEEKVHYKDAGLTINLNLKDTARLITVMVTEKGKEGNDRPVKDTELKIYVKRMFGKMPATEDNSITTDGNGEATFVFPKNIKGDGAGQVTVVAKLENNEQFGNIETEANTSWGIILEKEKDPFPRALWEPYAPIPLIITVSALFGGVWCIYFFIFYQMRKIKKEKTEIIQQPT
ncbi:MAG: hypothetical protein EPN92_13910 [Chitinophagaceae bacterium]|nr:MAG: hypothetical protein EPN92_13910 [Chitinophagaceae bacterium]